MMVEYIDRQEVIETVAFYREDPDGIDHALNSIKSIPSADVQPVVRCKDCKHFHLDYFGEVYGVNIIVSHEICDLWAGGCRTTQDTFCSNGERMDGEA